MSATFMTTNPPGRSTRWTASTNSTVVRCAGVRAPAKTSTTTRSRLFGVRLSVTVRASPTRSARPARAGCRSEIARGRPARRRPRPRRAVTPARPRRDAGGARTRRRRGAGPAPGRRGRAVGDDRRDPPHVLEVQRVGSTATMRALHALTSSSQPCPSGSVVMTAVPVSDRDVPAMSSGAPSAAGRRRDRCRATSRPCHAVRAASCSAPPGRVVDVIDDCRTRPGHRARRRRRPGVRRSAPPAPVAGMGTVAAARNVASTPIVAPPVWCTRASSSGVWWPPRC